MIQKVVLLTVVTSPMPHWPRVLNGPELAKKVSSVIGGKAGGKGNVFQGMGDKPAAIKNAVDDLESLFKEKLSI